MGRSIEQRLFEAFMGQKGLRLSFEDVWDLVKDDAIATRITNAATTEAIGVEYGHNGIISAKTETWPEFKERLTEEVSL